MVTSASFFPDSQSFTNSHAIQLTQTVTVSAATQTFTFSQTVSETFTGTVSGTIRSNRVNSFSDDTAGFLAGGQVGCDLQFAPRWVIGVEGEGEWARIKGATDLFFTNAGGDLVVDGLPVGAVIPGMFASTHTLTDWLASVTARVGYTPWDRWLFYVKGGAAWAGDKYTLRGFACTGGITAPPPACIASPFDFKGSETRFGWTAGLGIEYAFWNNWSWKLEYDFYDFGKKHVTFVDQFGNFPTGDAAINQRINVIKFGVNYNFFWGKAPVPVVAKY